MSVYKRPCMSVTDLQATDTDTLLRKCLPLTAVGSSKRGAQTVRRLMQGTLYLCTLHTPSSDPPARFIAFLTLSTRGVECVDNLLSISISHG